MWIQIEFKYLETVFCKYRSIEGESSEKQTGYRYFRKNYERKKYYRGVRVCKMQDYPRNSVTCIRDMNI